MATEFDVVGRWPELFTTLPADVRAAVIQTLASSWHEGWEPTRAEVANLVEYALGSLDEPEFFRRSNLIAERRR